MVFPGLTRDLFTSVMTWMIACFLSAMLTGCDKPQIKDPKYEDVVLSGKKFHLELALDTATRFRGLSDRLTIPDDGGMLFVFPRPETLGFVMRDCPIPIDIIFADAAGRVLATYTMEPEEPRGNDEKKDIPAENKKYEDRLKKYSSLYDAQFVIELKGHALDTLKIKKNDKLALDVVALKKRALSH